MADLRRGRRVGRSGGPAPQRCPRWLLALGGSNRRGVDGGVEKRGKRRSRNGGETTRSGVEPVAQQLVDAAGVGAPAGLLHHLSDEEVDRAVLAGVVVRDRVRSPDSTVPLFIVTTSN